MKCPYCRRELRPRQMFCPHCLRPIPPARGGMHLYRDRRHRLLWGRSRSAWLRLAAFLAVAAAAVFLVGFCGVRLTRAVRARLQSAPTPIPTATATPTAAPTATGTAAPDVTVAPTQSAPTLEPTPAATRVISSREELIDLFWWMIANGVSEVRLDALELSESSVWETADLFSSYFEAFGCNAEAPSVYVVFKTGVQALFALRSGDLNGLDDETRQVAARAQAAIRELVTPDMTDLEKELAIHDYIVENCGYRSGSSDTPTGDARGFFLHGQCQCAGYVDTFRLLGSLAGLEIEHLGGRTTRDEAGAKGHAWNLIRLDGLWYFVDVTWDDPVEDKPLLEHTYFNLPYTAFRGSRTWDPACAPPGEYAVTLDGHYYYNQAEYVAGTSKEAFASAVRQLDASGKAYLLLSGDADIHAVSRALAAHYQATGTCTELSEDLDLTLYRLTRR